MNKEILSSLVGKPVKVNRGGHEFRVGILLKVEDDYFAVFTEADGVLYYKTYHVKSLTDNTKKGIELNLVVPKDLTYECGKTFKELLGKLVYKWVTINSGGPENYQGVLDDVTDNLVTVIHNEEIIRISLTHIKTVGYDLHKTEPEKKGSGRK